MPGNVTRITKRKVNGRRIVVALNVIALGGNAILETDPSDEGQKKVVAHAAEYIAQFIKKGEKVVICHGNGPQVGNLLIQQKADETSKNPALKLDSCVAMTQGSIGYWLQNALINEFNQLGIDQTVVSLITQMKVDENDPSFNNPSKPIGPFLSKEEADAEAKKEGAVFKEDAGRGYRKVVASPMPKEMVEKKAVDDLVAANAVVICSGGGGVPVIEKGGQYQGVEAVNDKDFSASVIAESINAQRLIILTGVDNIYVNFNQPNQKALETITISEAKAYIAEGQFAAGSMLPKVQAAIKFVEQNKNHKAIITSIENLKNIEDGVGTTIVND